MPADVAVRPPVQQSRHLLGGSDFGGGGTASASAQAAQAAAAAALAWSAEEASGRLTLLGAGGSSASQCVLARVYRTSLEHFVVLYPGHRNVSRPLGVLNLRNTRVEPLGAAERGFTVRQRAPDAPHALTFLLCNEDDEDKKKKAPSSVVVSSSSAAATASSSTTPTLEDWLLAFTWRGSPTLHATPLPVVQEDEEF